jgi:hypothetical protein
VSHPLDPEGPLLRVDVRVEGSEEVITIEPVNDSDEAQRAINDLARSLVELAQAKNKAQRLIADLSVSLTALAQTANEESG